MRPLHVIGGEAAAGMHGGSGQPGDTLRWGDCLDEGPVRSGLSLEEMSRLRARFVAESIEGRPFEEVLQRFSRRDEALRGFKSFDETVLWFGSALGDQLQLLQVLNWFSRRELGRNRLVLCSADDRDDVTPDQLELARRGWEAVSSDRPDALSGMAGEDLSALPLLRSALIGLLEQYPWTDDGLSRAERGIMAAVADGPAELRAVFESAGVEGEQAPFLFRIRSMSGGKRHLVQLEGDLSEEDGPPHDEGIWKRQLMLTDIGRKVLTGQADCVRLYGVDRWIGGVHLKGSRAAWRWDGRRRVLVALRP
jgi:hypothetical protein